MKRIKRLPKLSVLQLFIIINLSSLGIALFVPSYITVQEKANKRICIENLREIGEALKKFVQNRKSYPNSLHELYPEYITDQRILNCPSDPKAQNDSYELFYIRCDPSDRGASTWCACGFHIGKKGLVLYGDGMVEETKFQEAKITALKGVAKVRKTRERQWVRGFLGLRLRPGESIETFAGALATIRFIEDASMVSLSPNTKINIKIASKDPQTNRLVQIVELDWGKIDISLNPADFSPAIAQSSKFKIVTPAGIVETQGVNMEVQVKRSGETKITVSKGIAYVKVNGLKQKVSQGESITIKI